MKKHRLPAAILVVLAILAGCGLEKDVGSTDKIPGPGSRRNPW